MGMVFQSSKLWLLLQLRTEHAQISNSQTQLAMTFVAVPCCQLTNTPYIFRLCGLLFLKIIIFNVMEKKIFKINSLQTVTIKAWLQKLISCYYFSLIIKVHMILLLEFFRGVCVCVLGWV